MINQNEIDAKVDELERLTNQSLAVFRDNNINPKLAFLLLMFGIRTAIPSPNPEVFKLCIALYGTMPLERLQKDIAKQILEDYFPTGERN